MAYKVIIEDKQDFEWLRWLMGKSYAKIQKDPTTLAEIASHVINISEALEKATKVTAEDSEPTKKKVSKRVSKKTKSNTSESSVYKYNYCKEHPLFPAKRAPRKDCAGCWEAYKKLHPNNYILARRNFERKYLKTNG